MHHVKLSRMPLFRTAMGWRWRKTFDMIAMTRVRRSRGTPWRKTEFQTCELRIQSRGAVRSFMHRHLRFAICDLRLEDAWRVVSFNRKSQISNRKSLPFHVAIKLA